MLRFLKGLFSSEPEKREINIKELAEWLDKKTKSTFSDLNSSIKEDISEIKEALASLRENLLVLKNAEVKDSEQVKDKVKHIVLGHRENYARVLFQFADSIKIPEDVDYRKASVVSYDIDERLNEVGKTTVKSYYAVQHLFHDDLEKIAKNLKSLSNLSKQIKEKIQQSKASEIEDVRNKIVELINAIGKKDDFSKQIAEQKETLIELENSRQTCESKTEEIKQSENFLLYEQLQKELQDIQESVNKNKNEALQMFSPLEAGLKKFKRITLENEDLADEYLDSSHSALLKDKDFKIIGLLQNMKKSILSGSVDLRDEKKEKILEAIDVISTDKLNQIVLDYASLSAKKENISKKLSLNPAKSRLKEIEYKIEHILFKTANLKEEIEDIEKKYNQIDLEALKKELENKIKEITNVEVIIML